MNTVTCQTLSDCSGGVRHIKAAIITVDKEQCLVKCSEKADFIVDVTKSVWLVQVIDHILEKHWQELHLPKIGAADPVTMLSNSHKFIFYFLFFILIFNFFFIIVYARSKGYIK